MSEIELTILMPCLNEAETLATCIRKAKRGLSDNRIVGEIVVADNGSTDGSQEIASMEGARVVHVQEKGYGAAIAGGIREAAGKYVVMGDADDSYDFLAIGPFVQVLRAGNDLVMGNRFRGGIEPGAMPFLHRYLGNPVLSWLGRLFFGISVGDFHCGLRGFNRERFLALNLRTTGMEFASEMIVRASLEDYKIAEVPTTLRPDGRSRAPHLRTWRDGWRHLTFLLMYSPRWLFLYPGLLLFVLGLMLSVVLFPGEVVAGGVGFDIHTFIVACFSVVIATLAVSFAILARRFATSHQLMPQSAGASRFISALTLERVLVGSVCLTVVGFGGLVWCLVQWAAQNFGSLEYSSLLRVLIISMTAITIGIQTALMAFVSAITEIPTK